MRPAKFRLGTLLPIKQLLDIAVPLRLRNTVRGILVLVFGIVTALFGMVFPDPFNIVFLSIGAFGAIGGMLMAIFMPD